MRLFKRLLFGILPVLTYAQSSSSSDSSSAGSVSASRSASTNGSASATQSSNSTQHVITTTLTTLFSFGSASPTPSAIVLTLTINSTSFSNGTTSNNTLNFNETLANATAGNGTISWNDTMDYLPFDIVIDGAYGTLGGLLILTGIPVAVLGGKNRWSSLAIASGYTLMLFTLTMILRFGVQPNLQPPSPSPPSPTLRGLYLLACIITAVIGSAIGIFLYRFAKYWVSAAGGFSLGWFLLATKSGGLITNVLGRWGLLGGLTVGAFVASLPEAMNPWMMLGGTAWIGATAFTLGVDCFTRGGLKEFYIYNLGFWELFSSLNGGKYPLTQIMSIELGILGAMVIIGSAIQFRVLNILQKRLKQMREEEEARIDAEEVSKAAERFKNVGIDLAEWEEKHGTGTAGRIDTPGTERTAVARESVVLPHLSFGDKRNSSSLSLLGNQDPSGRYDAVPLRSPTVAGVQSQTQGKPSQTDTEFLRDEAPQNAAGPPSPALTDPELESKLRLLDEVKKAREDVQSSLDRLTTPTSVHFPGRTTPAPSLDSRNRRISSSSSQLLLADNTHSRQTSFSSKLYIDSSRPPSAMDNLAPREKRISIASSRILDPSPTTAHPPFASSAIVPAPSEWDRYKAERNITQAPAPGIRTSTSLQTQHARLSQYGVLDRSSPSPSPGEDHITARAGDQRKSRPMSDFEPYISRASSDREREVRTVGASASTRQITGIARPTGAVAAANASEANRPKIPRTMTYEELSERHRKHLSSLQMPVTSKMREEVDLANAKEKWERQKRAEREEMQRREEEAMIRAKTRAEEGPQPRGSLDKREVLKSTNEWRRSVHSGLDQIAGGPTTSQAGRKGLSTTSGMGSQQQQQQRSSRHFA